MTNFNTSIASPHRCIDQWVDSLAKALGAAIKWRRRGNSLHILCEAPVCPDQETVVARVALLLKQQDINSVVDPGQPPIYQLWCYGRVLGAYEPAWSTAISPGTPAPSYASTVVPETSAREFSPSAPKASVPKASVPKVNAPKANAPKASAPKTAGASLPKAAVRSPSGANAAIAQQLARILSPLGIAVTTRIKPHGPSTKRLWVACQSSYSPDPSLIAEPLSYELRQLPLKGVRDAVVLVKVRGEERVDWILKIDLTPAEEILREWGRWGDLEAIGRLLNYQLESRQLGRVLDGSLTGKTLQFTYQADQNQADQNQADQTASGSGPLSVGQVLDFLATYLRTLAPRGVQTLQLIDAASDQPSVERLIAAEGMSAVASWELAQGGDLAAVQFLLSRALNADLDQQLATGGIRVQVLTKDSLMHVMCDGPLCPSKATIAPIVQALVAQLSMAQIHGVRVYGRRAGQRRPRWQSGVDFGDRQRFVPEPSPTFAATDAYVTELMTPTEAPPSLTGSPRRLWSVGQQRLLTIGQRFRRTLLRSQVFVPSVSARDLVRPNRTTPLDFQLALVWGAVGLLLFTQFDLAMGWWINSRVTALEQPVAEIQTQMLGDGPLTDEVVSVLLQESPFPSFNNPQLDLKLALYHHYLQQTGPPDVVAIGSSRAMRSLDPEVLEGELATLGYADASVFNFGVNGATAQVVDLILRRLLPPEHLPKLVLWVDGTRAFNGGRVDETYKAIATSEGYEAIAQGTLYADAGSDTSDIDSGAADDAADEPTSWSTRLFESYQAIDDWLSDRLGQFSAAHRHRDRIKAWLTQRFEAAPSAAALISPGPASPGPASPGLNSGEEEANRRGDAASDSPQASPSSVVASSVTSATPATAPAQTEPSGFLPIEARFDPSTYYEQYARVPGNYDRDYANFQLQGGQTEALQTVLNTMASHGVTVVFVNAPLTQEYLDPFRAGHEQTFRQYMIDTALQQDKFSFRDFSRLWLDQPDYQQYFSDPSHLNRYGAVKLSAHLAHDPLIPWPFTAE